jgi:NAD(P)H-flavin reductase
MSARCSLVVNGKSVRVSTGDTPLEAALADGMIASQPGLMGQGSGPLPRRAQARSHRSDAVKLALPRTGFAERPEAVAAPVKPLPAQKRVGTVTQITPLGPHTIEVVVTVTKRLLLEPGHGVVITFEGREPVTLSPTLRVDGAAELNELVFHLRLTGDRTALPDAFGEDIRLDHPVKIKGPVGRGYYRPGGGRLVLVAAETGFAPIWSIARAARYIEPAREVAIHIGARDPLDLYMRPSLDWLRATGVGRLVLVADRSRQRPPDVRPGPLTAHLPSLRTTDVVHVAGDASTVGAVEILAAAAGARCYPILLDAAP